MKVRNAGLLRDAMRQAQPRIKAAMQEAVRKVSAEAEARARFNAFRRLHGFSAQSVIVDDIDDWAAEPIRTTAIDVDADRIIVGEVLEP